MARESSYSAPALEKGLDILELLASRGQPMSPGQIAQELTRSRSELFRMIQVLLSRGYLVRNAAGDALSLSNRLFALGLQTAASRDLVSAAAPLAERLAREIGHAVNLVVPHRGETVVIASVSGGSDVNFSLRLGYRRPLVDAHSGLLLLAFQPEIVRDELIAESRALMKNPPPVKTVLRHLATIRKTGHVMARSRDVAGVTDIACPIRTNDGRAIASMSILMLKRTINQVRTDELLRKLLAVCDQVQARLEEPLLGVNTAVNGRNN